MIVIVEGIDRVGKTTLCEKLKDHGFIILKDGIDILRERDLAKEDIAIGSAAKVDTTFIFAKQLSDQGIDVVIDRCHLTELVYGLVGRGICRADIISVSEAKFACEAHNDSVLVLVEPTNVDEACKRAEEDLRQHDILFGDFFSLSPMRKFRTNFNYLDNAVELIMDFKEEWSNDCK